MTQEKTLFGKPASETIRMFHQVILTAFLGWLTLSIKDVNAEIHAHAMSIAEIQTTQGQVIIRLDGDIQEIRASLQRIETELSSIHKQETQEVHR